jgi:hypothetical protein
LSLRNCLVDISFKGDSTIVLLFELEAIGVLGIVDGNLAVPNDHAFSW